MNSQDRELLELAAKAGGITGEWCEFTIADTGKVITGIGDPCSFWAYEDRLWNPLDDDGDALRLGAKLVLNVLASEACILAEDENGVECIEYMYGPEDYTSGWRRAIVRAAAEIGKTK